MVWLAVWLVGRSVGRLVGRLLVDLVVVVAAAVYIVVGFCIQPEFCTVSCLPKAECSYDCQKCA